MLLRKKKISEIRKIRATQEDLYYCCQQKEYKFKKDVKAKLVSSLQVLSPENVAKIMLEDVKEEHIQWKNIIEDVEADTLANIKADHYPLKAKLRIKLKAGHCNPKQKDKKKEWKYQKRRKGRNLTKK